MDHHTEFIGYNKRQVTIPIEPREKLISKPGDRVGFVADGFRLMPHRAPAYLAGHADFADCIILAEIEEASCELLTFDRKLGKLPGTRLMSH
jgi:bifunctional DNA-binding transcriptional regulator/antitoxin component of YhaV-PrlF toxin-antitoxin module